MTSIFKYDLKIRDDQTVKMPIGAKILSTQLQYEKICLWALVDPANEMEERKIIIRGTGHHIDEMDMKYIGTVQMVGGHLVWHVFEDLRT